jgi:SHS2 domain-containing protein
METRRNGEAEKIHAITLHALRFTHRTWQVANGMGQGTGGKGRGKRRDGETVRRGHGETEKIYAITLYELRLEVTKNDAETASVCHRCQHLHRPFGL